MQRPGSLIRVPQTQSSTAYRFPLQSRYLIGIQGPPGCGKTTLRSNLEVLLRQSGPCALEAVECTLASIAEPTEYERAGLIDIKHISHAVGSRIKDLGSTIVVGYPNTSDDYATFGSGDVVIYFETMPEIAFDRTERIGDPARIKYFQHRYKYYSDATQPFLDLARKQTLRSGICFIKARDMLSPDELAQEVYQQLPQML
jgi:thymidylate kinase